MRNWLEIGRTAIFRDTSKGGLLSNFLKEYKYDFGGTIYPSCQKCLNSYWVNYIKSLDMGEEIKCDYVLHKKYEGIQVGFGGKPINNKYLTNEIAETLIKNHPRGVKLFSKIPEEKEIIIEEIEVVESEEIEVVEKPKQKRKRTK